MSLKTKSKGKALIVTQVKPLAYLSTSYTLHTSNFGSARGGAWVSDKGFASMELA